MSLKRARLFISSMTPVQFLCIIICSHVFSLGFGIPGTIIRTHTFGLIYTCFAGVSLVLNIVGIWANNIPFQTIVFIFTLWAFLSYLILTIFEIITKMIGWDSQSIWLDWIQIPEVICMGIAFVFVTLRIKALLKDGNDILNVEMKAVKLSNKYRAITVAASAVVTLIAACLPPLWRWFIMTIPMAVLTFAALVCTLFCLKYSKVFLHIVAALLQLTSFGTIVTVISFASPIGYYSYRYRHDDDRNIHVGRFTIALLIIGCILSGSTFVSQIEVLKKKYRKSSSSSEKQELVDNINNNRDGHIIPTEVLEETVETSDPGVQTGTKQNNLQNLQENV